jgi:hypothetical protein
MNENGLDILTISTKRTDFQADCVLLLGQVTEKKEKANPSHSLRFLLTTAHLAHLVLPNHKPTLRKTKRANFYPRF